MAHAYNIKPIRTTSNDTLNTNITTYLFTSQMIVIAAISVLMVIFILGALLRKQYILTIILVLATIGLQTLNQEIDNHLKHGNLSNQIQGSTKQSQSVENNILEYVPSESIIEQIEAIEHENS